MLTFREFEYIAEILLKHTTPEETQDFLDLDYEGRRLWTKNKIISLEVQA
ncbi:TPA: hypothetical protein ACGOVU_002059 [Streptococcus suis]